MKKTIQISLRNLEPLLYNNQLPWDKYATLCTFVKQQEEVDFHLSEFLATPQISTTELQGERDSYWTINVDSSEYVPLNKLDELSKSIALELLRNRLGQLHGLIIRLSESNDENEKGLAGLLSNCIQYPSEDYVYYHNNVVTLTAWGFEVKQEFKNNPLVSDADVSAVTVLDGKGNIEEDINDNSLVQHVDLEDDTIESHFDDPVESEEVVQEKDTGVKAEESSQLVDDIDDKTNVGGLVEGINDTVKEKDRTVVSETSKLNEGGTKNGNDKDGRDDSRANSNTGRGQRDWWYWLKRFLFTLLIILLIWFLYWLFFSGRVVGGSGIGSISPSPNQPSITNPSTNPTNGDYPKVTIQPPKPKDLAPDPTEDNPNVIVVDRLNVVLTGNNKNLSSFQTEFKRLFPSSNYEIIYSVPEIAKLQLKIPEDELESVSETLKNELTQFELLIFPERVMRRNKNLNDPAFSDNDKSWYFEDIQVYQAWDITEGSSDVIVAVIDGGFDLTHPELKPQLVKGWDATTKQNIQSSQKGEHGTHVACTAVGASNNNSGLAGIAPLCKLMPIAVENIHGVITTTYIVDAILYAMNHGAKVINISLGTMINDKVKNLSKKDQQRLIDNTYKDEESFWKELFDVARSKNIVITIAGGNDNILIGIDPIDRSDYPIRVSAVTSQSTKAEFSNYGPNSDISAPGDKIYSALPGNRYDFRSGTSMAAPIIAGAAALMFSAKPDASARQIKDSFKHTGKQSLTPNGVKLGNIIQIKDALDYLLTGAQIADDCLDIQLMIDSLKQVITDLEEECHKTPKLDTMQIPKDINQDSTFLFGRWKSSTPITNLANEPVELYFDFQNGSKGKLTLVEQSGENCYADLNVDFTASEILFNQPRDAVCDDGQNYMNYEFSCKPDKNGYAMCSAQNKNNKNNQLNFTLVKTR